MMDWIWGGLFLWLCFVMYPTAKAGGFSRQSGDIARSVAGVLRQQGR